MLEDTLEEKRNIVEELARFSNVEVERLKKEINKNKSILKRTGESLKDGGRKLKEQMHTLETTVTEIEQQNSLGKRPAPTTTSLREKAPEQKLRPDLKIIGGFIYWWRYTLFVLSYITVWKKNWIWQLGYYVGRTLQLRTDESI